MTHKALTTDMHGIVPDYTKDSPVHFFTRMWKRLGAHRKLIKTIFSLPLLRGGSYTELLRVRSFACINVSSFYVLSHIPDVTGAWEQIECRF